MFGNDKEDRNTSGVLLAAQSAMFATRLRVRFRVRGRFCR
jgi:23S rRNA-/tRNA-specific pseudouridylate synthase